MSDWDFLWEMKERGYSTDEIMEAAACGYAPYEVPIDYSNTVTDELFNDIESDVVYPVIYANVEDEEEAYLKEQIFHNLIKNAKEYFEVTGRYLQIWGELGEIYAELEFGLKRHERFNQAGSDGVINGKLVEVKTLSPVKCSNQVLVKRQGNFEQLLIIRISKNFEFKGKLVNREALKKYQKNFLKWQPEIRP